MYAPGVTKTTTVAADLTTMTPADVDGALAAIHVRGYRADAAADRADHDARRYRQCLLDVDGANRYGTYNADTAARLRADADTARDAAAAIWVEAAPYHAEYVRRGRWTRAFLVDNTGGHVHSSPNCGTCYPTTQYVWLPELSDHAEAEIVAAAGEAACTVCYPTAPVDGLRRRCTIEAPARRAARLAREAAKATRDAAKTAKAITAADGGPLRVYQWTAPAQQRRTRAGTVTVPARDVYDTLATVHAARGWLTDQHERRQPTARPEDVAAVAAAVAAKEGKGKTAAQVIDEARARAARRG